MDLVYILFQVTPEIATEVASNSGGFWQNWFPKWARTGVILLGGGLSTYIYRQINEATKLRKAIKAEVRSMEGIETCRDTMASRDKPSEANRELQPKEMPTLDSIPTQVYEANINRLGLLETDEIEDVIQFYSQVQSYRSTITAVRSGDDIPDADQNDLWDNIEDLEQERQSLFGEDWMDSK